MQSFSRNSPSRAGSVQLPGIVFRHMAADLEYVHRGIIPPGGIFGFHAGDRKSVVWVWDLEGMPPLVPFCSSSLDNVALAAISQIASLSEPHRRGVLIITERAVRSGSGGIRQVHKVANVHPLTGLPDSRNVRDIDIDGRRLPDIVRSILGMRTWEPDPLLGCGILGVYTNNAYTTPIMYIAHPTSSVAVYLPLFRELIEAPIRLLYYRSSDPNGFPNLDELSALALLDRTIQDMMPDNRGSALMLIVGVASRYAPSQVTAWRAMHDGAAMTDALKKVEFYIQRLRALGHFDSGVWTSLFLQWVNGKIVEPVPVENADTGEPVAHI